MSISQEEQKVSYTPQIPHTDDVETNENTFIHSKENDNQVTILFDPVIRRGIIRMEVLNVKDLQGVGIADDSVHYGQDERPSSVGWNKIVYYYWNGNIHHIGDEIEGNSDFDDPGHRITLELNMNTNRSLTFFIDDVEQSNYVVNIPDAVRFWCFFYGIGSSFKILKFEQVSAPSAKHIKSKAWEWGKEWN